MLPSTGWDDQSNLGRGYIQGRFRARELVYAEAEYRFGILRNDFIGMRCLYKRSVLLEIFVHTIIDNSTGSQVLVCDSKA